MAGAKNRESSRDKCNQWRMLSFLRYLMVVRPRWSGQSPAGHASRNPLNMFSLAFGDPVARTGALPEKQVPPLRFAPVGMTRLGGRKDVNEKTASDERRRRTTDARRPTSNLQPQSSLTRKTLPSEVLVSRAISSARLRSSCKTLTRTHQSPTGLLKRSTLAVL